MHRKITIAIGYGLISQLIIKPKKLGIVYNMTSTFE